MDPALRLASESCIWLCVHELDDIDVDEGSVAEIAHRATAAKLDAIATHNVASFNHGTGCGATMHTVSATHEAAAVEQ